MKRFFALLLSLAMVCGMLAACGGNGDNSAGNNNSQQPAGNSSTDTTTPPADSDEIKLADEQVLNVVHSEPNILDVARFIGLPDRSIFYNTLEPLVIIENGVVTEAGAESYEISEDGLTYTFHLRENYWSDGKVVTAEDYATALKRQADPQNAFSFASSYYSIENFEAISKGEMDISELGVEVVDEKTLVLHLSVVDPTLLSSAQFYPDRADLVEEYGDSYGTEASKTLSCGPFVLTEWVHNSSLTLVKNEKFWDAENVALETINCLIIDDANAQYASLENGSLDYLSVSDLDYKAKFEARDDMIKYEYESGRIMMLVFNCKDDVFSNTKIRQAFSIAVNRDTVVDVVANGSGTPAYGFISSVCSVGSYHFREEVVEPLLEIIENNPDPKALLIAGMEEAGLGSDPSTLTVTLNYAGTTALSRTYAELYQQMWNEALGVNIELAFNDSATHMSLLNSGDFQIASAGWGATLEPQFQLSRWSTAKGGQSQWINEEYVNLVSTGSATVDDKDRLDAYAAAEKLIIQEAAFVPLYYGRNCKFMYDYVGGLAGENALDEVGYRNAYIIAK